MSNIKWPRLLFSGFIAGLLWTVFSVAVISTIGHRFLHSIPSHHGLPSLQAHVFLLFFSIIPATWAVWLFAMIRPRFTNRSSAAVAAGFAWWIIANVQSAKWIVLLDMSAPRPVAIALIGLPLMLAVTVVGGWLYDRAV